LPQSWIDAGVSFTVGDITIQGNPIQYGAQITQNFQIALRGLAVTSALPPEQALPCQAPNPNPLPAPQQLMDMNLFEANSTSTAAVKVEQGQATPNIALLAFAAQEGATVQFLGGGVTASATDFQDLGQNFQLLALTISVDEDAPVGDQPLLLINPDFAQGPLAPGLLTVVTAGTLPKPQVTAAARARGLAEEKPDLSKLDLSMIKQAKSRY
jgi:hypothetical protein